MNSIISDILAVSTCLEDIIIIATTLWDLRERTTAVLQLISDNRLWSRPEECQFFSKSVQYLELI